MPDEPIPQPCWTCSLLIRELEKRTDLQTEELEKRVDQRFDLETGQREQLQKMLDSRLLEMNEFRSQILTERGDYPTREAVDVRFHALEEGLARLERFQYWLLGGGAALILLAKMLGWMK